MCHRLDTQDVHHTMSLLDEVNRTLDKNSTESLVDFLDRKWEAIKAYDAAMERSKIKALKIKYPGDSKAEASTDAALAAFEDDNTATVTDQPSDDTDAFDELTLEEEEMLLNEVRHYNLKYWAESSGPFAPEVRFDCDSI
eukprot:jgi/Tetstr1/440294/TSEL_003056.t1